MKKLLTILVIILIGAGAYFYWKKSGGPPEGMPQQRGGGGGMPVVTYEVVASSIEEKIDAIGTLEANESTNIAVEVSGKVASIQFKEGEYVKDGSLIIKIDDSLYKQDVERTKALYEQQKLTFERRDKLFQSRAVTAEQRDEAESQMKSDDAAYKQALIKLEKTNIYAPFDGIIGLRRISVGEYLNVGSVVAHIVSIDPIKVEFSVPEKYFSDLKEGTPVDVRVDAWPEKVFEGKIYAIDPQIDIATRSVTAKATIPNKGNHLRPGMFARLTLNLGTKKGALLVPEEALIPTKDGIMMFKVVEGKVASTMVTVGLRRKGQVEILEGIKAGDVIITAGHMKVGPGMPVTPVPEDGGMGPPQGKPEAKKPAEKKNEQK